MKIKSIICCLLLGLSLCAGGEETLPKTAKADFHYDATNLVLTLSGTQAKVQLKEGKQERDLKMKLLNERHDGQGHHARYRLEGFQDAFLSLSIGHDASDYVKLNFEVDNQGSEQLWLEPRIEWELPASSFRWFDGFEEKSIAQARDRNVGTIPFAAYYTESEGWALGLNPMDYVSHFRSKLSTGEDQNQLEYASKMVVDPGSTEPRRFMLFQFKPDFGYLNAVSAYWKFFPLRFQAAAGVHPNVHGPSNGGTIWRFKNEFYPGTASSNYVPQVTEFLRWRQGSWSWCYAGFGHRPGDWLCTEELTGDWMVWPRKENEGEKVKLREILKRSATEFMQLHNDAYDRLDAINEAGLMYIIPSYCEEELARERFADSIWYDPNGNPRSSGPPWVVRYDRSLQMYPYGNSFGDYTFQAVETIVERSNIYGFSYDCIDRANYDYTGPGTEKSPGRAYSKELGVYVNAEIANAMFGEKVHSLKRGDYTMALSGNFRGSSGGYLSASAMDAVIIEHTPWDERPLPGTIRLLLGQKSVSFLHGYAHLPQVENMEGEQLVSMLQTLADFTVLQCLRYGIYPSNHSVMGSPQMLYYSAIFSDLFRNYGWEPVPAVRGHARLWTARYGSGEGGVLFVGNATPRKIVDSIKISTQYFNAVSAAFVDYEGLNTIDNQVSPGETVVEAEMARGEALLLAASLHWKNSFSGKVKSQRQCVSGVHVKDSHVITVDKSGVHSMFVTALTNQRVGVITLNGGEVLIRNEDERISFEADLESGENLIEITYLPSVLNKTGTLLTETEFLVDEKTSAFTVIVDEKTDSYLNQVHRMAAFFTKIDIQTPLVEIPYKSGSSLDTNGLVIRLSINENLDVNNLGVMGEIEARENEILLVGKDASGLEQTVSFMLETLRDRYPSYGYLSVSGGPLQIYATSLKPGLFQKKTGHDYLPWKRQK